MSEKRNIILITFDSLRADHCSFVGYYRKTTPTLDKMAKEGLVFENAIASGVPTPTSMMGVFTGEYSYVEPSSLIPEHWRREFATRKTLAQILTEKGYSTGAVHENVRVSHHFGFNKGFKYYNDLPTVGGGVGVKKLHNMFAYLFGKLGFSIEISDLLMSVGTCSRWEAYYDIIINWIRKTKKPFFLWILLLDTHTPYIPPRKFRSNLLEVYYYAWKLGKASRGVYKLNNNDIKKIIDIYDSCICYADEFVKKLWKDVKNYDPILIIHSDHGDGFGEHGFYQHAAINGLYEELIHVPLIIYNASIKGRIKAPVSLLGIPPTVLELIGEENVFPSESLLNSRNEYVISKIISAGKIKVAVRTEGWKYIVGQKREGELYNLKEDPREQINLIYDHPDIVRELNEIAKRHIKHAQELSRIRSRLRFISSKLKGNGNRKRRI